jgi:NADH-quinone oxidoreductase subunit G
VAAVGPRLDLTYKYDYLGAGPETLKELAEGRHPFCEALKKAERPMLILGQGALARGDGAAILALARKLAEACGLVKEGWNGFNVLHTAAARVGGLELGFVPGPGGRDVGAIIKGAGKGEIEFVYLLGADEIDMDHFGKAFVVYQGHHGDAGAHRADVILPGAAYTEKEGTYLNTEGRAQLGRLAVFPPGEAKEDWTILRALSGVLGKPLAYDDLHQLRRRLYQLAPRFQRLDSVEPAPWGSFGREGAITAEPFVSPIDNFYMTDPISRASETMAKCVETFGPSAGEATGTHG